MKFNVITMLTLLPVGMIKSEFSRKMLLIFAWEHIYKEGIAITCWLKPKGYYEIAI
jgi:hypothetical protein